ncbi:anaerobic C4-dicarboxylate transporter [Fluviispira sanaruensis]|uniref:Anaerobic C4-dicarboxylate transporter n=1 Tax=Fluviispira sanaruensis TaxID=2493639 RepID=A0A4P2VPU7_FLUSA|nr:anaerobic C4-dicarboxylate transporter [Fluviispira sanaruensis]BBH54254.1 anaerobic C4-dicarboxylate transporter [Fluviispira sanaruensis]
MIFLEFTIIIACLLLGTRFGGLGLGVISGIGLLLLTFVFGLYPGTPPVNVMLTIMAVIACASILQTAGGLNVLMCFAEKLLRKHPKYITILAPLATWTLTVLCGTGHVVYTMFPIIYDIAIKKNIRPERPMAVASVASQLGICASPMSVAVVSMISILGSAHGLTHVISLIDLLKVAIPSSFIGVLIAAIWSLRRGKNLEDDKEFQEKIKDPENEAYIYGGAKSTLLNEKFSKHAYLSLIIFFFAITIVVLLGAFEFLRPHIMVNGKEKILSMNLSIQMLMLAAGAFILMLCKVVPREIPNGAIFKAGMVAVISVFGVAWMADTFFHAHFQLLEHILEEVVKTKPWTYAIVLFLVSKLVNSQAAAIAAIAPMGISLGVDPKIMVAFLPAAYGYFVLPTYPSDLACIGFDRSGTTSIGKYVINHSFIIPGLIGVSTSCFIGYFLVKIAF